MTLWNIIRDFFVQYVFGGQATNGYYASNLLGIFGAYNGSNMQQYQGHINDLQFKIGDVRLPNGELGSSYLSIGDWLSTTATIITLCAICVFLFLFVRWLFRLTAGLFQARG